MPNSTLEAAERRKLDAVLQARQQAEKLQMAKQQQATRQQERAAGVEAVRQLEDIAVGLDDIPDKPSAKQTPEQHRAVIDGLSGWTPKRPDDQAFVQMMRRMSFEELMFFRPLNRRQLRAKQQILRTPGYRRDMHEAWQGGLLEQWTRVVRRADLKRILNARLSVDDKINGTLEGDMWVVRKPRPETADGDDEYEGNPYAVVVYADGGVYRGDWYDPADDDKDGWLMSRRFAASASRNGNGTMFYPDGGVYEGHWFDDNREGEGTMEYANGDVYEGEWVEDMRDGEGYIKHANGEAYEGEWSEDEHVDEETQKNMLGEELYKAIKRSQPVHAGKITGMLIGGLEIAELRQLLDVPSKLHHMIDEALAVLEQARGG